MATSIHDVSIVDGTTALWHLKSRSIVGTLTPNNWTIVRSGSGTAGVYAQLGDVISSAAVLSTARAWWVMEGHGVIDSGVTCKRQLCWQTDGAGNVRVKVSPRAGFTGGTPSANTVPSATDERVWLGGGTDASPTFEALFPTSASWLQGEFSEYSDFFWMMSYPVGGGPANALVILGTTPQLYDTVGGLYDKDPALYYARAGSSSALATSLGSEQYGPLGLLAFLSASGASDAWVRLPAAIRASYDSLGALQAQIPGQLPQSPAFPSGPVYAQETLRCGRRLGVAGTTTGAHESGNLNTCGDKGEEQNVRYSGRLFTVPTILDAVSPSTGLFVTGSLLGIGNIVLPWTLARPIRDGA